MPLIERYIFRRCMLAFLLTLGALTATLWVAQLLRQLDVVTAKGQGIWVYLLVTVLGLPALMQLVAPVAALVAVIVTLNSLNTDNELAVVAGAGAARKTVHRPVLLFGVLVMVGVMLSYHVLAPASLSALRVLLDRVRADVIASLVQDGGFQPLEKGLVMHIREQTADGAFHGIFVSDERDPAQSLQYSAEDGTVVERNGGFFLVLRNGELIREDRSEARNNVVAFRTYAFDLSAVGAPSGAAAYRARERSTLYLLGPAPDDSLVVKNPQRIRGELNDRFTAPLHVLVFALVGLVFLGQPASNRRSRGMALGAVVAICTAVRATGFAASAAASNSLDAPVAPMYVIPLVAIACAALAIVRDSLPDRQALGVLAAPGRLWREASFSAGRMLRRPGGVA